MTSRPIVVIGAGVAGLAAAHALRRRGHSVIVLEARPRIGGRILTRHPRVSPGPVELGAELIHGDAPVTMRIVRAAGLRIVSSSGAMCVAEGGRLRSDPITSSIDRVFRLIDPRAPDEPFAQFLARRPGGRALTNDRAAAEGFVRGFHAADPEVIGARSLAPVHGQRAGGAATTIARLAEGQHAIPHWLAQDLAGDIHTRSIVTEIAWQRHRVEVRVREGTGGKVRRLRARAVVITVPIGVLKAPRGLRGSIAFRPEPPGVRETLSRIAMGSVTKVVFAFDELPWHRPDVGFVRTPDSVFSVWWCPAASGRPLAVAWSGGPAAAALDRMRTPEIIAIALRDLARAVGVRQARLSASVRGAWLHDWQHDPFSRGAYSYPQVGGANAGRALARPIEGTLFFAGEATSREWGTVEGALASGVRAARQVDAAIRS